MTLVAHGLPNITIEKHRNVAAMITSAFLEIAFCGSIAVCLVSKDQCLIQIFIKTLDSVAKQAGGVSQNSATRAFASQNVGLLLTIF